MEVCYQSENSGTVVPLVSMHPKKSKSTDSEDTYTGVFFMAPLTIPCNESFSVLPASSKIMTWRLTVSYESSVYSLGVFLTISYNLN